MKKFPKIVQCDSRGQIVIPKDVRRELGIDEGTGFWVYTVTDEGILLKKAEAPQLEDHQEIIKELEEKADKIKMSKTKLKGSVKDYRKTKEGNLELL